MTTSKKAVAQMNPFPPTGLVRYPQIWADRKELLELIKEAIGIAFRSKEVIVVQIHGTYGSGKTHTLKHIEYQLTDGVWAKQHKSLPIYVENPGTEFYEFYNNFMFALKLSTVVDALKHVKVDLFLARAKSCIDSVAKGELSPEKAVDALGPTSINAELRARLIELLRPIGEVGLEEKVSDFLEDLAKILIGLTSSEEAEFAAKKWLTLSRMYKSDLELLGLERQPSITAPQAAVIIAACLRLVASARVLEKIVVLIDEVETLQDASPDQLSQLGRFFRALIDAESERLCVFLATSQSASVIFKDVEALGRRIHMTIKLTPLDEKASRELVKDYLKVVLAESYKPPYGILSEKAIDIFTKASKGTIFQIISLLSYAYDRALREGKTMLTPELANEYTKTAKELGLMKE